MLPYSSWYDKLKFKNPSFYVSLEFAPSWDSTRVFTTTGKAGPTGAATSR